tara:strand:+ start:630 stop:1124 length:495 start_codon:yes stop_codon:yes gene_type:complete
MLVSIITKNSKSETIAVLLDLSKSFADLKAENVAIVESLKDSLIGKTDSISNVEVSEQDAQAAIDSVLHPAPSKRKPLVFNPTSVAGIPALERNGSVYIAGVSVEKTVKITTVESTSKKRGSRNGLTLAKKLLGYKLPTSAWRQVKLSEDAQIELGRDLFDSVK